MAKTTKKKKGSGRRGNLRDRFVKEYLVDFNATQAAIRAGYAPASAGVTGARLLKDAKVAAEIAKVKQETGDKLADLRAQIVEELRRLAFFDPRKLYEPDGSVKLVDQWDDQTAAAIAYMDVAEIFAGQGEQKMAIGLSKKVALHPKPKALELLMKHLGMFAPEKVAQTDTAGNDLPQPPADLSKLTKDELIALRAIQVKLKG